MITIEDQIKQAVIQLIDAMSNAMMDLNESLDWEYHKEYIDAMFIINMIGVIIEDTSKKEDIIKVLQSMSDELTEEFVLLKEVERILKKNNIKLN